MANLTLTNAFSPDVYRIETTDPVLGGENEILNKASKTLGSNDVYLKKVAEQVQYVIEQAGLTFNNATKTQLLTAIVASIASNAPLPTGYLDCPVPTYDSAQPKKVNFNGAINGRSKDNTVNISLASASRNLDLATNGANGLADGLTVANTTWYYAYAYSGGTVASTTNGASTLTIGTVSQKVVQLPLALRTDGSANILPFSIERWGVKSSAIRYNTNIHGYGGTGLVFANSQTYIGQISSASYLSSSLASFVPPISRSAELFIVNNGGGGGWWRTVGSSNEYSWDFISNLSSRLMTVITDSSQAVEFKRAASNFQVAVTGYTINL